MPDQTFSEELYDDTALKEAVDRMANLIKTHATKEFVNSALDENVSELKNDIDNIVSVSDYYNLNGVTITDGQYIKSDGTIGESAHWRMTDYIELPPGVDSISVNRIIYSASGMTQYPQTYMVFWYDDSYTRKAERSHEINGNIVTSYAPASGAKYARINFAAYHVTDFVKLNYAIPLRYIRAKGDADTADSFTDTGVYWIGSATEGLPGNNVGFLSVLTTPFSGNVQQTWVTRNNSYTRLRTGGTWKPWIEAGNSGVLGVVGSYQYQFTTTKETKRTEVLLKADTTYRIVFKSPVTGRINVYGYGNTSNLKRVYPWMTETYFANDGTDRTLYLYNYDGTADYCDITVYEIDSVKAKSDDAPRTYVVSKTANTGDYTSLTKCLFDLKDDLSPKMIEIWEGEYDIYAEYKELYDAGLLDVYDGDNPSLDYFDYCVWVPENTHIIGKGIVRLKWMPDPTQVSITPAQCKTISPLNVAASCTIENVEVYCKNGRYCLHNDALGKAQFTGAVQRYIGCRFYKYANDTDTVSGEDYGFLPTTGFGIDRAMHHVYQDCTFINYAQERAFYGHSRGSAISGELQSSDITLDNCVIDTQGTVAVKFGNGSNNRNIHIRTMFNDCYISSLVKCQLENSGSAQCANGFDVQYLNCGNVSMQINDTDNPYDPKAYNTNLTMVS